MLKRQHLEKYGGFLQHLLETKTTRSLQKELTKASYYQLRALLLLVAAVALRKLPSSDRVKAAFYYSKKKKLLKQHFRTWASVKRLLAKRNLEEWRHLLLELAPLVRHSISVLFYHG